MKHLVLYAVAGLALVASPSCSPSGASLSREHGAVEWADGVSSEQALLDDARILTVPGSDTRVAVWEHRFGPQRALSAYAISVGNQGFSPARLTDFQLLARMERSDPKSRSKLSAIEAGSGEQLYVVQFFTHPLASYRVRLRQLGARVHQYFPRHAHLVVMTPDVAALVASEEFVRHVGRYRPELKLGDARPDSGRAYWVQPVDQSSSAKAALETKLRALGAGVTPRGFLLRAHLTPDQLQATLELPEVLHVDEVTASSTDVDVARALSGADFLEGVSGFDGTGIAAEVMDGNVDEAHPDFASHPILLHGDRAGSAGHGTATTGIIFGDGSERADARGFLPKGQGIFASYDRLDETEGGRRAHTEALLGPPYRALFQSNSWGGARTEEYTNVSAEMDAMLFELDFLLFNSQSNSGTRLSRPQAWAKNVVSIGGVKHRDTLEFADDGWDGGGSIGPATDGRIKPDLAHFWDATRAPKPGGGYTESFGGTSGATPITAGLAGLYLQMWASGLFGDLSSGTTAFDRRPHFTTSKAILINTATQWDFQGEDHDLTRVHQGWGRVDLQRLYQLRNRMFLVNETDVLAPQGVSEHAVYVPPGEPALRATLVYADPAAVPGAAVHRVNDLTLKVVAPDGTEYFGNHGLTSGPWSVVGGGPDALNTVENVFVQSPMEGTWTVVIRADEVVQDGHVETPEIDADYALVVTGVLARGADDTQLKNRAPRVDFERLESPPPVSGGFRISAVPRDPEGAVAKVIFYLPDGTIREDTTAPYALTFDSTKVADGTHQVTAVALDVEGLSSEATFQTVEVKNTP